MKNIVKRQAIGILGGMAPYASNYMYDTLIKASIQSFGAQNNDDFPEIILYSIPVPDFISNDKDKKIALNILKDRVRGLNNLKISYLSIACNTAHVLLDDLQAISSVPFISVIDEVVNEVSLNKLKKVGLLGSPSIIRSRLYQDRLDKHSISTLTPNKNQKVTLEKVIRNIIRGSATEKDIKVLSDMSDSFVTRGAEGIILGCTELPLVFPKSYKKVKIYNSVEILSLSLLQKYYK